MSVAIKGRCPINKMGVLKIYYQYRNEKQIPPAIKRHTIKILENRPSTMNYGTALQLSEILNVPLNEIIEVS